MQKSLQKPVITKATWTRDTSPRATMRRIAKLTEEQLQSSTIKRVRFQEEVVYIPAPSYGKRMAALAAEEALNQNEYAVDPTDRDGFEEQLDLEKLFGLPRRSLLSKVYKLPLHQKRQPSSRIPLASKYALKQLRAKKNNDDLSPIATPPPPYSGVLTQTTL